MFFELSKLCYERYVDLLRELNKAAKTMETYAQL